MNNFYLLDLTSIAASVIAYKRICSARLLHCLGFEARKTEICADRTSHYSPPPHCPCFVRLHAVCYKRGSETLVLSPSRPRLQCGASEKLKTLIEGESLVNDGSASVVFFLMQVSETVCDVCTRPKRTACLLAI